MLSVRFSRFSVAVLFFLSLLSTASICCGEEKQIFVYRASHTPVGELETALRELLDGVDDIRIASTPISNSMAIIGDSDALQQIGKMLGQLDRSPEMIRLHVYVIQPDGEIDRSKLAGNLSSVERTVRDLTSAGKASVINEVHLTTLEQQEAMVQAGKTKAVPTGRSGRSIPSSLMASMQRRAEDDERLKSQLAAMRSRSATSYQRMNVGSLVKATPRIGDEGTIYVDFAWERSDVEMTDDEDIQPDLSQATAQTTITVKNGEATLVQEIADPNLESRWLLVVGAETVNRNYESASDASARNTEGGESQTADNAGTETSTQNDDVPKKYMAWAKSAVGRYDKNGDGMLSKSEQESMRRPPSEDSDTNEDGLVSPEELARSVMPK
ncbi:MAG: hypothetical protein AAF497_14280 [Planctomycetota bacterium]